MRACLHEDKLPDHMIWRRKHRKCHEKKGRLVRKKSTVIISLRTSSPLHSPCPNTSASRRAEANGSTQRHHVLSQSVCSRLPGSDQLRQTKYLWRVYATWFDLPVDFQLRSRRELLFKQSAANAGNLES